MRHHQYRDSLLERLRQWRLSNPDATINAARTALRQQLTEEDIDLLFDNWLNANFDRIELRKVDKSTVAVVHSRYTLTDEQKSQRQQARDALVNKVKSNLFAEFSAHIWDMVLPNGTVLRDATRPDLEHAGGWFTVLAKRLKPGQKLIKQVTTKQLFDLAQRNKRA